MHCRGRSALSEQVKSILHASTEYLDYLRRHGAQVHASSAPKTDKELQLVIKQDLHQSAIAHQDFLWGEAYEMCQRRHTMVLPVSALKGITGICVSPPGIVPQAGRQPRTICNLTFWGVNAETVQLTPNSM